MVKKLDRNFRKWLLTFARKWKVDLEEVARLARRDEIMNRWKFYPDVKKTLLATPFEVDDFAGAAKKCWVLRNTFDGIRFRRFVKKQKSREVIAEFIADFPSENNDAALHINNFIDKVVSLGISTDNGSPDRAGAAQLTSLVLTTLYPKRFVDFRRNRWLKLANTLNFETPDQSASYGELLIWAGKFAQAIAGTPTFKELWPKSDILYREPLWVLSGICWKGPQEQKPLVGDSETDSISYPEGSKKQALHTRLERNQSVVRKAKEKQYAQDVMMRCQVCNFSFLETYGEHGDRFIEAHHIMPLGKLNKRIETKLEDISLVCANCHRMIHRGKKTLSLDELRDVVKKKSRQ